MFDITELMKAKEKYDSEVIKLRNIVLSKFKDVAFLKKFDWKLCLISSTVKCSVPDDWQSFMKLIEVQDYPYPILGLDEPFHKVSINFDGRRIHLSIIGHETLVNLARLLNANMDDSISILKVWIENGEADLKRTDLGDNRRREIKEGLTKDELHLKNLLSLHS